MKLIMGGHWDKAPQGWTALTEKQQDITRKLNFKDGAVDAIFTEHVVEHISMISAVGFMRESLRVLRPGGIFRCVAPMTHVFTDPQWHPEWMARYTFEQMRPYYEKEIAELQKIGLGLETDWKPFLVDFLVRKHGHQFCWSGGLMASVLKGVGFSDVHVSRPGLSVYDPSTCLERTIRGTNAERFSEDFPGHWFDPESGVVEAVK